MAMFYLKWQLPGREFFFNLFSTQLQTGLTTTATPTTTSANPATVTNGIINEYIFLVDWFVLVLKVLLLLLVLPPTPTYSIYYVLQRIIRTKIGDGGHVSFTPYSSPTLLLPYHFSSGSMYGPKLSAVKSAMICALHALPPGCLFDVIASGTEMTALFRGKSGEYTDENLR